MLSAARHSARLGRCAAGMLVLAAGLPLLPGHALSGPVAPADILPVGGFLETAGSGVARPRLGLPEIQALLPARGTFLFPPPYGTEGVRITNADDCGGTDCVSYVGYSYWRNINNHAGRNEMQILLGLDRGRGGPGPSLFVYDKTTGQVSNRGPLFDAASPLSWHSAEGWYWSAVQPDAIYLDNGPQLLRYDVAARSLQTVFDATSRFGPDRVIRQAHSSDDDRVHSATLLALPDFGALGCVVYHEDTAQFQFFPKIGTFNECHVDKSGRWLVSLEDVDGLHDLEMRVFDLETGDERLVWDQAGAVGHADMGFGYVVGTDDWNLAPNAILLWDFARDPLSGLLVSHSAGWSAPAPAHIAHGNARPGVPLNQQFACGSTASRTTAVWSNEIICFRLDGSPDVLVVAPVMTDLDAAGGGNDYAKEPKGNLDVTGQYFIWTGNAGGDRLDAFLVKVPAQLLLDAPPLSIPPSLLVTGAPGPVTAGGTITYTLRYANPGPAGLTGVAIRDRVPPETSFVSATSGGLFSGGVVTWEIGSLPGGSSGSVEMTVRAPALRPEAGIVVNGTSSMVSREAATISGPQVVTAVVDGPPPVVDSVVEAGTASVYVLQGGDFVLRAAGANFRPGARLDPGPGISAGPATFEASSKLAVPVTVQESADLGPRTVTVTNPDGLSGSRPAAIVVVKTADIDGSCRIDGGDLNVLARAWNSVAGDQRFSAAADLDGDQFVGPLDLVILAEYFGQRLAACP
ncbi:MAG TPA: dockerin type I domain-containing protein [Candidatus Binatia bacterium]|nr:dockerin type I domain-containing protein [Candidatus Binatia bacterium]